MIFPEKSWEKYIRILSAIDKTAARKFTAFLDKTDISTQDGRKAAIDYAYALATKYGEMAAAGACEMYDAVAEASGVVLPAAVPAETATYGEVAKTVNGMAKQNQSNEAMGNGVGRLVKRAGADTTLKNAIRDGAEFAWVPHGDTCSFCLMLASNGWQKASKKTIKGGHAEHIHANCDCTFAIRFDGKSSVGGYDPDKYREMYENAEGDTWEEKLNSMRRAEYAENADKIREQKRKAYDRRKTLIDLKDSDIIKSQEMHKKDSDLRSEFHFISDARFNELVIPAKKKGAVILRGIPELEEHLIEQDAAAACIGDTLIFRKEVAISEVLEELRHFDQNLLKMNDEKEEPLRSILNEIEAKRHVIDNAGKYKIPRNEIELLQKQLIGYEKQLSDIMKGR